MILRATIQPTQTRELTAEASDAQEARQLIEQQVPDGYDLIQVHNAMPRGGRTIATGIIRPSAVEVIDAEAQTYDAAKEKLAQLLPEGWRVLAYLRVD